MNIQDGFPLGLTGLISLQSKGTNVWQASEGSLSDIIKVLSVNSSLPGAGCLPQFFQGVKGEGKSFS